MPRYYKSRDGLYRRRDGTLLPQGYKECAHCLEVRLIDDPVWGFTPLGIAGDGYPRYRSWCKECRRQDAREVVAAIGEHLNRQRRTRHRARRASLTESERERLRAHKRACAHKRAERRRALVAERIIAVVCDFYGGAEQGLTPETMRSEARHEPLASVRQMCVWQLHVALERIPVSELGRIMKRDHSTILYTLDRMRRQFRNGWRAYDNLRWERRTLRPLVLEAKRAAYAEIGGSSPRRRHRYLQIVPQSAAKQQGLLKRYWDIRERQKAREIAGVRHG